MECKGQFQPYHIFPPWPRGKASCSNPHRRWFISLLTACCWQEQRHRWRALQRFPHWLSHLSPLSRIPLSQPAATKLKDSHSAARNYLMDCVTRVRSDQRDGIAAGTHAKQVRGFDRWLASLSRCAIDDPFLDKLNIATKIQLVSAYAGSLRRN